LGIIWYNKENLNTSENPSEPSRNKLKTKMLKLAKYAVYLGIAAIIWGLFWFMPKYSYVQKNPGYCVNLTKNLYYCGNEADLKNMFNEALKSTN
jgi:hypothetical protein